MAEKETDKCPICGSNFELSNTSNVEPHPTYLAPDKLAVCPKCGAQLGTGKKSAD
jgi:uncharacterized protein with PIN domain